MLELLTALLDLPPIAPPCTSAQMQALLQPASSDATPLRLTCFAILPPGTKVERPLLIEGAEASGTGMDCRGGSIGDPDRPSTTLQPTIAIQSRREATAWSQPLGVHFVNCTINGNVRIWGMGANGRIDDLRLSSRTQGHTAEAQAAAPSRIGFDNVTFAATGSIPLYVGPGVTRLGVRGGQFIGRSASTAIYLDAESAETSITNVAFSIRTAREQIAIDGSARNRIEGNSFALGGRGGVFLYRNCGEDGVIRHQTPSDNVITGNIFTGVRWLWPNAVVVGSREGRRRYCGADTGWSFGSSADDGDHAERNVVADNVIRFGWRPF